MASDLTPDRAKTIAEDAFGRLSCFVALESGENDLVFEVDGYEPVRLSGSQFKNASRLQGHLESARADIEAHQMRLDPWVFRSHKD